MEASEWLRDQLATFECPACGRVYRGSRMRLLAERDGLFFVDLVCVGCRSTTVAIVTVEVDDRERSIADANELRRAVPAAAVSADDVIDMHQFLAGFQGDIKHLLRADAARSDGAPPT